MAQEPAKSGQSRKRLWVLGACGAILLLLVLAGVLGSHSPRPQGKSESVAKHSSTTTAPPPTTTTVPAPTTTTAPPPTTTATTSPPPTTTVPVPTTTTAPAVATGAHCTARATPANDGYAGDYNVYVQSNQPNTNARAHDATDQYGYETNQTGYAVIYLWTQHPGEQITVTVGSAHCSATA